MGNNLSSGFVFDTSKSVFAPEDKANSLKVLFFWVGSIYACAMIFSTCALIDRWKGPMDRIKIGVGSVLAAMLMSTAWPVVMAYLLMSE